MHDRAVGTGARDGRKGNILEQAGVASKAFERSDRVDFGERAARSLAIEPGEETRHGRAVADMRRPRAGNLRWVLDGLHQRNRARAASDLASMGGDEARERVGGRGLIEPYGLACLAERCQRLHEICRLAYIGEAFETVTYIVRELATVDKERGPSRLRNDGEGERQRRVGDVRAADVEGPSDGMGIRDDQRVGAQLHELGADAGELVLLRLAGEAQVMQHDRAQWRGGTVAPDRVDQVGLHRHQCCTSRGAGLGEALRAFDRVQPGIVAKAVGVRKIGLDPAIRWRLHEMLDGEQRGIDLLADLKRVAAVDEQHRPLHQHDRGAGGTGETGEPGETLLGRRHIFVLVPVGAWNDKAGQAAPRQLSAQRGNARPACRALGAIFERLEAGLEHGGTLLSPVQPGNAASAWQERSVPRVRLNYVRRRARRGRDRTSVAQPSSLIRRTSTRPRAR